MTTATLPRSLNLAHRIGLVRPEGNSNHLAPTKKRGFLVQKSPFSKDINPASDTASGPVSDIVKRKPLRSISGYPYRPARLVLDKRSYIVFYAWDIGLQQMVRKRVLYDELAEITSDDERIKFAQEATEEITDFLKHDWHLLTSRKPRQEKFSFRNYTLLDAFDFAVAHKRSRESVKESSISNYTVLRNSIVRFLEEKKMSLHYALKNADASFWDLYFSHIKVENTTYNFRRGLLHAIFTVLIKKDSSLFEGKNPISEIDTLRVKKYKHAAFTDDQLKKLSDAVKKKEPHVFLFMQFMFYTLARPKELIQLKIGHIDLQKRKILIPAESSKTDIENYVGISDRFYRIIVESGIMNFPAHYYVFNNAPYHVPGQKIKYDHNPGLIKPGDGYFYKRIVKYLKSEGLRDINRDFTPYAIKHTGAISLFLATKDVKIVQMQCRHENMETTLKYLRDLGTFTNFERLQMWDGPI